MAKERRAEINTVVVKSYNCAREKMQDFKEPEKASDVGKLKEAEKVVKVSLRRKRRRRKRTTVPDKVFRYKLKCSKV